MDVFDYFGLQSPTTVAAGILAGDPADLHGRAATTRAYAEVCAVAADDLRAVAEGLTGRWSGEAADLARAAIDDLAGRSGVQATQLTSSAASFDRVGDALTDAQARTRVILQVAGGLQHELERALSIAAEAAKFVAPGLGIANSVVEHVTGVDVMGGAADVLADLLEPIEAAAVDCLIGLFDIITAYDAVLRAEASVLHGMRGVVRADAGPVDAPGDEDLRRGALFRSVYGRDPSTPNERLMAEALDAQGSDATNSDPNADVTVLRITPVPGGGVIHGSAFISSGSVFNFPSADLGDNRGFDPDADPDDSRVSFFVDYENGIVVVRQNASHSVDGDARIGVPTVGVEQDAAGRVRLRTEATNPLAPGVGQMAHVSVRNDLVIDPHGGTGSASVNGQVTRFPSWEVYQHRDGQPTGTLLQREENALPGGAGPMVGLPQPTVPVGSDPGVLDTWRADHHKDQGHDPLVEEILELPGTRGDDFFDYDLPPTAHPSVDRSGDLVLPGAGRAR